MAVVQPENVADLVADTLKYLGKPNFTDISSNLQNHPVMSELLLKKRFKVDAGYAVQFDVLVNQSTNARHVSVNESDAINTVDGMVQASTVWRSSQTSYQIIRPLASMNMEPARIVDYVLQQRIMAMIALAELFEAAFWGAPSATDTKTPLGLPYWVTKNATKGFTGGALTGFTTIAGLSPTTYANWNNWAAPYTSVTRDDFIRQVREARVKTDFKPVVDGIPSPNTGGQDDYGFYTNYAVMQPLEEALESQNDNLGSDIASMDGKVMFARKPVNYVAYLDRDTTNPFYGLHWGWFKVYILKGWWMQETNLYNTPGQHLASSHWIDCWYQFVNRNRRAHFVASNGTSYP